jgi:general secretion pathway protein E
LIYEKEMGEKRNKFYYGTGCNFCALTGYHGRMGVYEILVMSEEIRRLVLKGASADEIKAQAMKEGMVPMWSDGMLKVKEGLTTPYEVLRNVFVIG